MSERLMTTEELELRKTNLERAMNGELDVHAIIYIGHRAVDGYAGLGDDTFDDAEFLFIEKDMPLPAELADDEAVAAHLGEDYGYLKVLPPTMVFDMWQLTSMELTAREIRRQQLDL